LRHCPGCGATIKFSPGEDKIVCEYCLTSLSVDYSDGKATVNPTRVSTESAHTLDQYKKAQRDEGAKAQRAKMVKKQVERVQALEKEYNTVTAQINKLSSVRYKSWDDHYLQLVKRQEAVRRQWVDAYNQLPEQYKIHVPIKSQPARK
jgi:hypothetical protein